MLRLVTETQLRYSEQMINADVLGDGIGYVKFIENFGSDERIIESARMSTGKGFLGWSCWQCDACKKELDNKQYHTKAPGEFCSNTENGAYTRIPRDEKLLRYLWENKHATPFEMGGITIEVKAPIMVFREWHRHRTQSYNEFSARYAEMPEEFYVPSMSRLRMSAQSMLNKQGSGMPLNEAVVESTAYTILTSSKSAFAEYQSMLKGGVAKEVARLVLPVNTYSKMRASTDLRNWFAFLTLRDDPNAQWEIQQYAKVMAEITRAVFPRSYGLYEEGRKNWSEFRAWMQDRQAA